MDNMVVDHKGYLFKSINEMCKHWNISRNTYKLRISSGWNIEDALTKPPLYELQSIPSKDHLGHSYKSIASMCKVYGVVPRTFVCRIKSGWSVERALTEEVHNTRPRGKVVKSFEGLEFKSKIAMCKHYGVSKTTYNRRMNANYSQRDSLLIPSGIRLSQIFKPSMALDSGETKYYAIVCPICNKKMIESKSDIIEHLIKHGKKKNIVTKPKSEYIIYDKKYSSLAKLCDDFSITRSALQRRLKLGHKLEEAVKDCISKRRKPIKNKKEKKKN